MERGKKGLVIVHNLEINKVIVQLEEVITEVEIRLFDSYGEIVIDYLFKIVAGTVELDISNLNPDVYTLTLRDIGTGYLHRGKITKQTI